MVLIAALKRCATRRLHQPNTASPGNCATRKLCHAKAIYDPFLEPPWPGHASLPFMDRTTSGNSSIQTASTKHFLSEKVEHFTESVIREMTRQAMLHGAVNLAQGFPDFPAPAEIKQAAQQAVAADVNQYAITWGAKNLRNAIARQMGVWQKISVDPEKEVTVCCGSTEAMISTLLALCNAGDEIVVFEPFYENYGPDSVLSG